MATPRVRGVSAAALNEGLGIQVSRATAALPQTAAAAIFTVTGRCLITGFLGEVTTAIQNQANNTKITANPTTGDSVDLCAVLNIANDGVGTFYGITGTFATAMVGAGVAAPFPSLPIVVDTGTIDLYCAASNTGSVAWDLWYIPLEAGAGIVAA